MSTKRDIKKDFSHMFKMYENDELRLDWYDSGKKSSLVFKSPVVCILDKFTGKPKDVHGLVRPCQDGGFMAFIYGAEDGEKCVSLYAQQPNPFGLKGTNTWLDLWFAQNACEEWMLDRNEGVEVSEILEVA